MENPGSITKGSGYPLPERKEMEDPNVQRPPIIPRVKFLCSYGGRIQPRPGDNRLVYFGGETKILSVDRTATSFQAIMAKLSALSGAGRILLKYQLPGQDLDALVSVTNDEDVEHLMAEQDRWRSSRKLRLFLFDAAPTAPTPDFLFGLDGEKSENQLVNCLPQEGERGENPATKVIYSGDPAAHMFPPVPPKPMTLSMRAVAPGLGYFPVAVGPGYVRVPCQAGMFPPSHFSGAGIQRVGYEALSVNPGHQQVYYTGPIVSVEAGYQMPASSDGGLRQVSLGKPPLPA